MTTIEYSGWPSSFVAAPQRGSDYRSVSRFPAVRLDLAFLLDYDTSVSSLLDAVRRAAPRTLVTADAFDVYRGDALGADARSVSVRFVFQSEERTLTDKDVARAQKKIVGAAERLGVSLRGAGS